MILHSANSFTRNSSQNRFTNLNPDIVEEDYGVSDSNTLVNANQGEFVTLHEAAILLGTSQKC